MNTKRIITPIVALFLLAGCTTTRSGKTSKQTTSSLSSASKQPIPSYPDLPSYPDYDPDDAGIAPNHITAISITPTKEIYARVGDIIPVNGSVSGPNAALKNDDLEQYLKEKTIHYSVDKTSHLGLTVKQNSDLGVDEDASLKCLAVGDATLTAKSWDNRYIRNLVIHILPNDGTYDLYETALTTDAEKSKFGFQSSSYLPEGLSNGVSQLGHQQWKWHREKPSSISTSSGALSFGTANFPEGAMDFSTYFAKPVKSVTLGLSTARFPIQDNDYSYGGSKLTASLGENSLTRVVGGKTFAPGEECYTLKGTDDNVVLPHKILCNDQSGNFEFHLSASGGYTRIKYIVVEYADYTPAGTLTEVNYSFDDEAFTSQLTDSFASKTVSDSSNAIQIAFKTGVKNGDESTSNHPMVKKGGTITITPKNAGQTIASVEFVTSPFIFNDKKVENIIDVQESYLGADQKRAYGTERSDTITLSRLSYGCNLVEFKATQSTITTQETDPETGEPKDVKNDIHLGIVSLKVTLTDAVAAPVVDEVYMAGSPIKTEYDGGDSFDPLGAAIVVNFTDPAIQSIQINDLMTWPELTEGDTETTGTSSYGSCLVTVITTGAYVNKVWTKATSGTAAKYLAVSRDTHKMLDGSSSDNDIKSGNSNRDISTYFENDEIHGDYALDHSYLNIIAAATAGKFQIFTASGSRFNGRSNTTANFGKISLSGSSAKNHSFEIRDGELVLYYSSTAASDSGTFTFCLTTGGWFGFIDFDQTPEYVQEHVDFYCVA